MLPKDTLEKAYGHIVKEPLLTLDFDILPMRGIKYYWIKFKRLLTR